MSFSKSARGYSGTFDSDALQVTAIPFSEVTVVGSNVRFVRPGEATTALFEGALDKDMLSGGFKEGAPNFSLRSVWIKVRPAR